MTGGLHGCSSRKKTKTFLSNVIAFEVFYFFLLFALKYTATPGVKYCLNPQVRNLSD